VLQELGQRRTSRVVGITRSVAHALWVVVGAAGSVLLVSGAVNANVAMIGAALVQLFLAALFLAPRR
jgi:hypothetical protein